MLAYKAEYACRQLVRVNLAHTSQDCPQCGIRKKKALSERWHKCQCGFEGHRDVVAAQMILQRAGQTLYGATWPVGASVPQESHARA